MEIVTQIPSTNCTSCKKLINVYYYDSNHKDRICVNCLIKVNNYYPVGICCYRPCNLCQSPYINELSFT